MVPDVPEPSLLFRIVSDPTRLRILRLLEPGEMTVRELVAVLGLSQPAVSKHLAVLRDGGWVTARKEGTWSWYGLVPPADHPAGERFARLVLEQARREPHAAADDAARARVVAERQGRAADAVARLAETWDRIRPALADPEIQAGTMAALVPPGRRILDVGTGGGALLPALAATGARVLALDRSAAMLDRARDLAAREGIAHRVAWLRGDAQALPLRDGCRDAVICAMVLHHVADPAAAVREMARVLAPGGSLVLVGFTRHDLAWLRERLGHVHLGFTRDAVTRWQREAGLAPERFLRRPLQAVALARAALPAGLDAADQQWPDVFLATARRNADETTDDHPCPPRRTATDEEES